MTNNIILNNKTVKQNEYTCSVCKITIIKGHGFTILRLKKKIYYCSRKCKNRLKY